jgi:hypothetical protein
MALFEADLFGRLALDHFDPRQVTAIDKVL